MGVLFWAYLQFNEKKEKVKMKVNRWVTIIVVVLLITFFSVKSCKSKNQAIEFTGNESLIELEEFIDSDDAYLELLERDELLLTAAINSNQITANYLSDSLSEYIDTKSRFNLSNINSDKLYKILKNRQDNRQDYYMIKDEEVKKKCLGVAGILYEKDILENEIVITESYKNLKFEFKEEDKLLCSSVKFYQQKTAPFCTAFAVSDDIIITAGHCVSDSNLDEIVFVFDLKLDNKDDDFSIISEEQIFYPKVILDRVYDSIKKLDYTIIEVEKTIPKNRILDYSLNFNYTIGTRNYIIGHPSGLPIKFAPDGYITQRPSLNHFQTNLNAFSGNSGSPIFDEKSNKVIGIFIAGENKFTYHKDDDCIKILDCHSKNCTKEIGIKLSKTNIKDYID